MKRSTLHILAGLALLASYIGAAGAEVRSSPTLGMAEGRCRPGETGPAFLINAVGLKDRGGTLKVELYPANDDDFLQDDNILINEGKPFRRAIIDVPAQGPVQICIRAPGPGPWALSLLHDRDGNRKFGLSVDGVGFAGNPPSLGPRRPHLDYARAVAGNGVTSITVRMLYRSGLFSFGPAKPR